MKIKIDEFRIDAAQPVEAPLDFTTLCSLLAAAQAATPTARLARDGTDGGEAQTGARHPKAATAHHGSFHAAAAARFTDGFP